MKETKYDRIQIEDSTEEVIGEITIQNGNFIHAEIFAEYIGPRIEDIQTIREFLDIVEQKIKECKNTENLF